MVWKTQRTLLLVGEGADEWAFLTHVKGLFISRGCGLSLKIKNAQGKGAKHVVEWTVRHKAIAAYDTVAVLVATDTDWSDSVSRLAAKKKIHLLLSEPCFEALMMRILKEDPSGDASTLKKRFAPFVKDDATRSENYMRYFGRDRLLESRSYVPTIDMLLSLLGL
jgi:hypothetical protein